VAGVPAVAAAVAAAGSTGTEADLNSHLPGGNRPQIGYCPVRLVPLQLGKCGAASCYSQDLRSNGSRAANVQRRVADHQHLVAAQVLA
jgi:hypothetical protein